MLRGAKLSYGRRGSRGIGEAGEKAAKGREDLCRRRKERRGCYCECFVLGLLVEGLRTLPFMVKSLSGGEKSNEKRGGDGEEDFGVFFLRGVILERRMLIAR